MDEIDKTISERIKARAKEQGVKIQELASALGIPMGTMCNKMYGYVAFRAREVYGIAQELHCSTDYLYGLRDMTDEELQEFAKNAYIAETVNSNIVLRRMKVQELLAAAAEIMKKKVKKT